MGTRNDVSREPSVDPVIQENGQEYLVITPRGLVLVALSLAEAEALARLNRKR